MIAPDGASEREISISAGNVSLAGNLAVPRGATAVVLFAHGSGSSRKSPRNRYVAQVLHSAGVGTLLFDLLTPDEESADEPGGEFRFNIPFLASRLIDATRWTRQQAEMASADLGFFGASTGAAAALVAAAEPEIQKAISAVVSRGGRPDLAGDALMRVNAPTLLIVGGRDEPAIGMNRRALAEIRSPVKELIVIPGATHLFEEPGALEKVARLAAGWFQRHLATGNFAARAPGA